jgi:hypothetical protein
MATSQQFLVCDSSTLANFKAWAQPISAFFATAGWTQSSDTGQVNWSSIASVPGSGAYVYEIWQPNDGLTNFYAKIEYGNVSGTNCPGLRVSIGTATNGSGTLTGFVMGPQQVGGTNYTPPSTTTQYECNFSGALGRIGIMMWRNTGLFNNSIPQFFAIERSVNSSGSYTGTHVTLLTSGQGGGQTGRYSTQTTLLFGVGVGPSNMGNSSSTDLGGWQTRMYALGTSAFNGAIPFDTVAPCVGYFDYPLTVAGTANPNDVIEGVTFTVTVYGATRTYMPSKVDPFKGVGPAGSGNNTHGAALCMRYD